MRFLSAKEDLHQRTLNKGGRGPLGRIVLLLDLREDGKFRHWGLERTHGLDSAMKALEECFYCDMVDLTREDLAAVFQELNELNRKKFGELLCELSAALKEVPQPDRGPRSEHFNYVVEVLRAYLNEPQSAKPIS
jgi:hypothetical protein